MGGSGVGVRLWRRGSQLCSCIMLTDQQLNSEPPRGVHGCVRTYVGICFLDACAHGFGPVGPCSAAYPSRTVKIRRGSEKIRQLSPVTISCVLIQDDRAVEQCRCPRADVPREAPDIAHVFSRTSRSSRSSR